MKTHSYSSYFNPYSQEHRSLETFSKLPTIHKVGIVFATILVSIITVGIASCAIFRSLVEYSFSQPKDNFIQQIELEMQRNEQHYSADSMISTGVKNSFTDRSRSAITKLIGADKIIECYSQHISNVGNPGIFYKWTKQLTLNNAPKAPNHIKNARVLLPKEMTHKSYNQIRRQYQSALIDGHLLIEEKDITAYPKMFKGITIEATMPFNATLLPPNTLSEDHVKMHAIYQSGLNFDSKNGGLLIAQKDHTTTAKSIKDHSKANCDNAIKAAIDNKSDVLVYNINIGTGDFAGKYSDRVKQANIDAICQNVKNIHIRVIVPNTELTNSQIQQLEKSGITFLPYDKYKIAALCAHYKQTVSLTIATDAMTMLGIQALDEYNKEGSAAISTGSYLAFMPINVVGKTHIKTIPALNEYLVADTQSRD